MSSTLPTEPSPHPAPSVAYFDLQASWGFTKHLGGTTATDTLLTCCRVGADTRLLEIGCGVGITPCYAAQTRGCRVAAVDLSERMIGWARRRVLRLNLADRITFTTADAQHLPFPDHSFDAVICESVLAFVPDQHRALAEYARVTRPGGYVGLAEGAWLAPPPPELEAYLARAMGGAHFLSPDDWATLLQSSGLAVISAEPHRVRPREQWRGEVSRLDRSDLPDYVRAWRTFLALLVSSAEFRHYIRTLWPSSPHVFRMFDYFGYGIVVGRKTLTS
ncbi:MAG: hypothetical protein RLZZ387_3001 [Chloroflexota bacterium]